MEHFLHKPESKIYLNTIADKTQATEMIRAGQK
jgi:hypothetical protein